MLASSLDIGVGNRTSGGPAVRGIAEFGGCGLEPAAVGGLLSRNL